ncbi:hypothetical protein [Psychrobacter sp. FDAARGOS_221]|uniref:hypothetical protein n=1 Tax=Psychrobacter sp. FDAARGOS_221 TaxID=1975705 RepID=UPI000BB53125|nr:hypothetical protein [Psychrobacter sp. FDAARGOS_221]PNK60740.1 hypothetical protein A6J60_007535 [Psychrobacter sp. FDAARGOS_221]
MTTTAKNHWLFWGFWILINALTSFIWGSLLVNSALWALLGMLLGIMVFIVIYGAVDHYFIKHNHLNVHRALRRSVFIKAGLQLLNVFVLIGFSVSPEIWAGIIAVGITDEILGINQIQHPFLFALLSTLFTGALLSLLVAALTAIIALVKRCR